MCLQPNWIFLPKALPIRNAEHEVNQKKLRKPIWHFTPNHYAVQIPCGECPECLLEHAKDWASRCAAEMEIVKKGCFVTLTYNNGYKQIKGQENEPSLPINENGYMTLNKKDLTLFWKRLRKHLEGEETKIRYVACGEYGPKHQRPHYHAVIFNWEPNDLIPYKKNHIGQMVFKSKTLQKIWGMGFVTIGKLNFETASYTARYTLKKSGINKQKRKYNPIFNLKYNMSEIVEIMDEWTKYYECRELKKEDYIQAFMSLNKTNKIIKNKELKEPEFIVASNRPGIGYNYFKLCKDKIIRNNGIMTKVKNEVKIFKVPKYFKKKWKEEEPEEYFNWAYQQQLQAEKDIEKTINQMNYPKEWEKWKKEIEYNKHRSKLIISRFKHLKRINIEK